LESIVTFGSAEQYKTERPDKINDRLLVQFNY